MKTEQSIKSSRLSTDMNNTTNRPKLEDERHSLFREDSETIKCFRLSFHEKKESKTQIVQTSFDNETPIREMTVTSSNEICNIDRKSTKGKKLKRSMEEKDNSITKSNGFNKTDFTEEPQLTPSEQLKLTFSIDNIDKAIKYIHKKSTFRSRNTISSINTNEKDNNMNTISTSRRNNVFKSIDFSNKRKQKTKINPHFENIKLASQAMFEYAYPNECRDNFFNVNLLHLKPKLLEIPEINGVEAPSTIRQLKKEFKSFDEKNIDNPNYVRKSTLKDIHKMLNEPVVIVPSKKSSSKSTLSQDKHKKYISTSNWGGKNIVYPINKM